ncbi:radical SAM protein [Lachnoclostridium sp. An76]|uniref:radical SAM protein n=1 Tax=Lachnoclostridium sp. An76 TaxID=1965654 RepID=UPI000B3688CE|nr:radical SAM protein [Lachnoclostridium sp. An76]OUN34127.1 radical SAM protein [Lachnoclostridium sp. An76]
MSETQFGPACRRMEWLDPFYKAVWEKAYADAIPISGTFELTPRCNFNCRMCYVHLPENEIERHGAELTAKEWVRIAQEAKEAGTTWLCITGGEPLMHPGFETIWQELTQMGFFITLQTNASLVTKYDKLFEECPPRACKITLYGSNDDVYRDVCRVEKGFTRADEGIQMLREMKIPVELVSTIIQQNLDDVDNIIRYVGGNRFRWIPNINVRTAGRGVDVDMEHLRIKPPARENPADKDEGKEKYRMDPDRKPCTYCRDYRLGYWIVWNGYMRFCSFMNGPDIPVREKSFKECWEELVEFQEGLQWPEECTECEYRWNCTRCAALFDIEDGRLKIRDEFCVSRKE